MDALLAGDAGRQVVTEDGARTQGEQSMAGKGVFLREGMLDGAL